MFGRAHPARAERGRSAIQTTNKAGTMALHYRDTHADPIVGNRPTPPEAEYDGQQAYFLARLTRLVTKAALLGRYLVPGDRRMRLLNHAILATYDDCRALGLTAE